MFDKVNTAFSYERELIVCSFLRDFSKGKESVYLVCIYLKIDHRNVNRNRAIINLTVCYIGDSFRLIINNFEDH